MDDPQTQLGGLNSRPFPSGEILHCSRTGVFGSARSRRHPLPLQTMVDGERSFVRLKIMI